MKRVMIHAYTNNNLGDDLFIETLCKRYPKIEFVLYAPKVYIKKFNNIQNLKIVVNDSFKSKSINYLIKKINYAWTYKKIVARNCDAAVYIGGSVFMQQKNWKKNFEIKKNFKIKNKPYFVIGANFGPFRDREFYFKYKETFKTYTDICFRDKYSFNLFKDLNNVRIADDVIFQLKRKKEKVGNDLKNIVISVIKPSIRKDLVGYDEIYYEKIKEIIIQFVKKDFNVTLMSFCKNEGDEEAVNEIIGVIPDKYKSNINKHFYSNNIEKALTIISKSNFIIATRFHAMILGWVYDKPVYPITYSKKMINVMKDIEFKGLYTDFENLKEMKVEEVFDSIYTKPIDISAQRRNAEKQFEKLDEYLKLK